MMEDVMKAHEAIFFVALYAMGVATMIGIGSLLR